VLFNSYEFILLFLPLVLGGYLVVRRFGGSTRALQALLTLGSLVFFWSAGTTSILLLAGSSTVNYLLGRWLARATPSAPARRVAVALGIVLNVGTLAVAKYWMLLVPFVARMTQLDAPRLQGGLPLAISFYTFLQIAYLVDCYRVRPTKAYTPLEYLLFVVFFPHLIAGPLVHHRQLIPQLQSLAAPAGNVARDIGSGMSLFVLGLSKKVLIADTLAPPASAVFEASAAGHVGQMQAMVALVGYTLQIYFDFSGYSDMAIGLARMFSIDLPENFRSPYQATSIVDFWRRWHITLSRFLLEYVYIPLGGNRYGTPRRYLNLMLTMLLGGAWHGAGWTFVIWGGLHGAFLCANQAYRTVVPESPRWTAPVYRALTIAAVMMAWIFFRAPDLGAAMHFVDSLFTVGGTPAPIAPPSWRWYSTVVVGTMIALWQPNTGVLFGVAPAPDNAQAPTQRRFQCPPWTPTAGWVAVTVLCGLASLAFIDGETATFIYYKF